MNAVNLLLVGLGGALGAMMRYMLCLVPNHGDFPIMTLAVNLIGAFLIGVISGFAASGDANRNLILFLKTGVCGGFTTFSTFSLETLTLLQNGKTAMALIYAGSSLIGCVIGVKIGEMLGNVIAS
jgi:CrcB protein